MKKINEDEFLNTVKEIRLYNYKQSTIMWNMLFNEHPELKDIIDSIKSLEFHNKNKKVFDRMLTTFENTILSVYKIIKNSAKRGTITFKLYSEILKKEMEEFEKIEEIDDKNILKQKLNDYLNKSSQPFLYSFLYFLFPNISKDSWDKSIGLVFFFRTKALIECFNIVYL
ncbi:MAG: hypothetical protein N3A58_06900 [Spirochaetes bacterium]|nr:hypothetical protein [Spirochaetota bacterium]